MIKLLICIGFTFFNAPAERDSLGIETINGKVFVIHKVDEKETLYSISRRYHASVDEIRQFNAGAANGLEIGQILKVPYTPKQKTGVPPGATIHKVAPKETLFSIAKTYNVSLDDIKNWNNLTDNALSVGQELVIRKKSATSTVATAQPVSVSTVKKGSTHTVGEKETMYSIARQYGITVDQLKQWNNLETTELKIGQVLKVSEDQQAKTEEPVKTTPTQTAPVVTQNQTSTQTTTPKTTTQPVTEEKKDPTPVKTETPVIQETIKISESVKNGDEVIETGIAELIEGTEGNRKYLALHRTAPIGTILKVKNEMNNREVFVRVMGKLPDTAFTDKLVIKISKSAYDRLGAIDPRFRVEVTYYK